MTNRSRKYPPKCINCDFQRSYGKIRKQGKGHVIQAYKALLKALILAYMDDVGGCFDLAVSEFLTGFQKLLGNLAQTSICLGHPTHVGVCTHLFEHEKSRTMRLMALERMIIQGTAADLKTGGMTKMDAARIVQMLKRK